MTIQEQKQQILSEIHQVEANIYRLTERSKQLNTALAVLENLEHQQQQAASSEQKHTQQYNTNDSTKQEEKKES
ncbi:hypothetical protein [Paenibacillus naphthalenovorans]|uniref:hypothetical protein n=1 Tax=Paenibacillus naphthalenovorans TaxID=162209 RepID=UPI0008925538|nr:hypothetical protein [Paenibacillus naphthalenovorans]SDI48729.1 hypothetical protein SAMN05421868_1079 [Paenibacillus naphthalenovorans]